MIPYTYNEIRRLLATVILHPVRGKRFILRWSHWRRRHQAAAELSHYKRRDQETQHPDYYIPANQDQP